jgi:DNA primase
MNNSPIEEIKNRLDILEVVKEYVKLQKSGINYRALCPFHSEKTPSFFVSPSRQTWHCFGSCSEGGDIFKFIMKIEGVEFGDALRILATKAGVELKKQSPHLVAWKTEKQKVYEICEWATRFYEKCLETEKGKEVVGYLLGRGISKESIKEWRIGYSPEQWDILLNFLLKKKYSREEISQAGLAIRKENTERYYDRFRGRIMFPIFDFNHQPIGFGGRVFGEAKEAKYLNTPNTSVYDKSKTLYGLDKARTEIRKKDACILVEGYTDVIMSFQAGVENVVSTSGTALTQPQLNVLKRYSDNLITAFDMDTAGDSATKRGIDLAQEREFNIKVALMPDSLDPADLINGNPEQWKKIISNAVSITSFYFQNALNQFDPDIPENKKKIAQLLLPVIKKIPNEIERDSWIQELARKLNVKEDSIIEELKKVKEDLTWTEPHQEEVSGKKSRKQLLEERFLMLIVSSPEKIKEINFQETNFLSQETRDMIEAIINKDKESPEIQGKLEYLRLKMEIETTLAETEKEIMNCLSEMKIMEVKEKLNDISQRMKEAENKDQAEELKKLSEEFNFCCRKLSDSKYE